MIVLYALVYLLYCAGQAKSACEQEQFETEKSCKEKCADPSWCEKLENECFSCEACVGRENFDNEKSCSDNCQLPCTETNGCFQCEKPLATCDVSDMYFTENQCKVSCPSENSCSEYKDCWYCARCEGSFYTKQNCQNECPNACKQDENHCFNCPLKYCSVESRTRKSCELYGNCSKGCVYEFGCYNCVSTEPLWTWSVIMSVCLLAFVVVGGTIVVCALGYVKDREDFYDEKKLYPNEESE